MGKIQKAINKSKVVPAANRLGLRGKANQEAQKALREADRKLKEANKSA